MKRLKFLLLFPLLAVSLTACGTHSVSTAADQVGLHYLGGPFSSKKYDSFIPASTKQWFGPGDKEYLYPNNRRTFDATGGKGAESNPITSVSKDSAEMATPVSVTFQLDTDPKTLRKFHETIGNRYKAYMSGDEVTKGWENVLGFYIGQALNTTLDREVQQYNWRDLYNHPELRTALQAAVDKELPQLVDQQMNGHYFTGFQTLLQQPTPTNQALKDAVAAQQAAVAAANSQKAQADAQRAAAEAQIAVSRAEAQKKQKEIAGYGGVDNYNRHECIVHGCNPYQPTYIYGAPQPQPQPSPSG